MEILIDHSCTGGGRGGEGRSCRLWTRGDEIEKRFIIEAAALSLRGSAWALRRTPPSPPPPFHGRWRRGRKRRRRPDSFFLLTLSRRDVSGAAQREGLWGKSGRMKPTAQLSTRRPSAERPVLPPHIVRTRRKVLSAQRRPRTPPRRPRTPPRRTCLDNIARVPPASTAGFALICGRPSHPANIPFFGIMVVLDHL